MKEKQRKNAFEKKEVNDERFIAKTNGIVIIKNKRFFWESRENKERRDKKDKKIKVFFLFSMDDARNNAEK